MSSSADQAPDPYRHWDGQRWLRWDGVAWVPEVGPGFAAPGAVTRPGRKKWPIIVAAVAVVALVVSGFVAVLVGRTVGEVARTVNQPVLIPATLDSLPPTSDAEAQAALDDLQARLSSIMVGLETGAAAYASQADANRLLLVVVRAGGQPSVDVFFDAVSALGFPITARRKVGNSECGETADGTTAACVRNELLLLVGVVAENRDAEATTIAVDEAWALQ